MNLSTVAMRIKLDMGIYGIALPVVDVDSMIVDILKDITLRVFSIYAPYRDIFFLDPRELEEIERTPVYSTFLLPETQNEILYVRDVKYANREYSGGAVGYIPNYFGWEGVKETITGNAGAKLANEMHPTLTFKFTAPRKLKLFNLVDCGGIAVELAMVHDKSFMSITPTSEESFYKLALLDVMNGMYGMVKHSSTLQTAIANIDLKIDDWANAREARDTLLEKWDDEISMDNKEYYG